MTGTSAGLNKPYFRDALASPYSLVVQTARDEIIQFSICSREATPMKLGCFILLRTKAMLLPPLKIISVVLVTVSV